MLERLRILIQNRNATVGSPEEGKSCGPERGPAVSSSSLPKCGQSTSFCRTQTIIQESKGQSKTPSKLWGFSFCRANKEVSIGDGEKVRALWDCCKNCKISPHSSKPPEGKPPLPPPLPPPPQLGSRPNRLEAHSWMTHHSATLSNITADSSALSDTAASTVDTLDSATTSIPSIHSGQDSLLDVEIIMNSMQCAHRGEKMAFNNSEENISFLRAISASCLEARKSGKDTLDLPYTKAELAEALVMVMETLPGHSVPSGTLSYSMVTAYNLSKIKPPLDSELESCILRLALHGIFSMEIEQESSHSQALYKSSSDTMETMLKGLLYEVPTTSHLLFILKHINFWIHSPDVQERARAMRCSTVLLQYAIQLPDFQKTGELPALGYQVAQYGICITDPLEDVNHQAREAIKCLYQLLLHHMGLSPKEGGELWCRQSEETKLQAYMDTCRVGELFRKIFTEDQKRTFLQTSLLSMYDPLRRRSEAGVLLGYSLLGKADRLMGDKAEDMERNIYEQLFKLRTLRQVPEALQSIIPSKVDNDA
nr:maestro heat-like repeat-containing protein family member 7 isoform X2 [Pogona vitticeps]